MRGWSPRSTRRRSPCQPACCESFHMGPAGVVEIVWEVLVQWDRLTRWLRSRLACDDLGGRRVRVGGGSRLKVGSLVVERNFTKFFDECTRDNFWKRHEPGLWVRGHGQVALEGPSTVSDANPGTEDEGVAAVESGGCLMMMEAAEFAMISSARSPTWCVSCQCFHLANYQGKYTR
jgi:hypothetical protein